jgi:hypothetical protein
MADITKPLQTGISRIKDECLPENVNIISFGITFDGSGDFAELDSQTNQVGNRPFSALKGMFISMRARTDSITGLAPWMRITVQDTGQFFDIAPAITGAWTTFHAWLPIFATPNSKITFEWKQGTPPSFGDLYIALTNFEISPFTFNVNTNNEVG